MHHIQAGIRMLAPLCELGAEGGMSMKYKVIFNKWAYVEADSEDEALDKAADGDTVYEEEEPNEVSEVDEFFVEW